MRPYIPVWTWQLVAGRDRVIVTGTLLTCRNQKRLYQEGLGIGTMRVRPITEAMAFGG